MIFKRNIFIVYLDGFFAGITEKEDEIWKIAQDHTNDTPHPLTDDNFCDRVWYHKIDINRFYRDGKNACDKLSNKSFLCANCHISDNLVKTLNEMYLSQERERAKIRAMTL